MMPRPLSIKSYRIAALVGAVFAICHAPSAAAGTITYATPSGSTTSGGSVDASAQFTTGAGVLDITLTDLQANPKDVAQLISDLEFTLNTGATTGTLASSSAQTVTVSSGGTFTLGTGTVSTGWGLNNGVSGGLQLDAIGFVGPAHLIIGPPGTSGYSNANGSIAGNGPHNPFLNQTASFFVDIAGLTAADTVTGATFSFGTTAGTNTVPGTPVPLPAALPLLGLGLAGLGAIARKKRAA